MWQDLRSRYTLLFAFLGALFFIPFLGGVHLFDWDEINFAEISREMLILKDYTRVYVNFEPFYQKPPLFFWLQAASMKLLGAGEFAARFPNAICGALTLALLFRIGQRLKGARFGMLWAGAYFGSVLPFLYFKSGIIDPWFNLFIFLGLYQFILFYWKKEGFEGITLPHGPWRYLALSGFWIGLAMLTKGQAAFIIVVLCMGVYWVYQRFRLYVSVPQFLFFTLVAFLVTSSWFGAEVLSNGPAFVIEFFQYQYRLFSTPDAGHKGFPGYHFAVLLVGCFPASIFAIRAFFHLPGGDKPHEKDFRRWMKYLFWAVLILFSIVQSKIVHYSSLCYFPLTYLAALSMEKLLDGSIRFNGWMRFGFWAVGGIFVLATIALPILGMQAEVLRPVFKDPFAQGNLEAGVHWTGLEMLPGLFLAILIGAFFFLMRKGKPAAGFRLIYGGVAIFVMWSLFSFAGRIEGYSQRAAIEFFKEKSKEDCHLAAFGYKSYAHLFYGKPQRAGQACFTDMGCINNLLYGPIDKPAYIVTKVHRAPELAQNSALKEIGRKNGFVFFRRAPAGE